MIRIIVFILIFAIFLAFIVFNLDNRCNVSLGIIKFKDIPVFLTAFFSFVLGMFFTIPLILSKGRRKNKGGKNKKDDQPAAPPENGNAEKDINSTYVSEIGKSPYGIN